MRNFLLILFILFYAYPTYSQDVKYNTSRGYIAHGYDVVSYFNDTVQKGNKEYIFRCDGIKLKFVNQENLNAFQDNPEKYMPQYGGWCAYAMGNKGGRYPINPFSYEIRDGKLYLFFDTFYFHALDNWLEQDPNALKQKADKNWEKIKQKKRKK